jgi:hypothetical protein
MNMDNNNNKVKVHIGGCDFKNHLELGFTRDLEEGAGWCKMCTSWEEAYDVAEKVVPVVRKGPGSYGKYSGSSRKLAGEYTWRGDICEVDTLTIYFY